MLVSVQSLNRWSLPELRLRHTEHTYVLRAIHGGIASPCISGSVGEADDTRTLRYLQDLVNERQHFANHLPGGIVASPQKR